MNDLVSKYNSLEATAQKEVNDFVEFLLSRQKKKPAKKLSDYKKKILAVSVWSASDVKGLKKGQKLFDKWTAKEW